MRYYGVAGPMQARSYCIIHTYSQENHEAPWGGWQLNTSLFENPYMICSSHLSQVPETRGIVVYMIIHSSKLLNSNIISPMDRKKMLPLSCRKETKQTQNCPFMGCQRTFYCFLHFKGTLILLSNAGVLLASGSPLTLKDTFLPGVVSTLHSIFPQHRIQGLKKSVVSFGVFLQNGFFSCCIIWQIAFLCWHLASIHSHLTFPSSIGENIQSFPC